MSSSSDDDEGAAVVIDNGSYKLQAGFAGDDAPRVVIPSIIGRPHDAVCGGGPTDTYVGDAAQSRREMLSLKSPFKQRVITNWDVMEKIWTHVFKDELRVSPEEYDVMLTQPPLTPKHAKERAAEMMFESFHTSGIYLVNQASATLYSSGRNCGLVVDIGHQGGHVVPLFEGYTLPHATATLEVAGLQLTNYLSTILKERGHNLISETELHSVDELKRNYCYTSSDYDRDMQHSSTDSSLEKSYTLPDGGVVTLGRERFRCPEALFQPPLCGVRPGGIQNIAHKSIMLSDPDIRKEVCNNIVLSGGSTMFPGFGDRLREELSQLVPKDKDVRVIAPPERKNSVWIGGSILASLSSFKAMWLTKEEYEEHGASIVHERFFE